VVLVVEDEASYQDALNVGLTVEGFVVVGASTIAQARAVLNDTHPDLVLLDVMLPDGSGIDFCRELYDSSNVPVIMVSRMRAVLRRPATIVEDETFNFGDLRIDVVRRTLMRQGSEVELSRKEFDLLALFASRLGQVVTREVCLDTLWWGLELSDTRTLDTHVKRLRQKIEDDPATPRHLLTIRGVGFRLDA